MATGIIGTMAASTTLRYTPTSDAKVGISGQAGTAGIISINGVSLIHMPVNINIPVTYVYVGANQTITIATPASVTAIVSSLESV